MTEHLFLSFQGMGLEFGLNMFTFGGEAFHKAISHVLGVAYELLGRDAFIDILRVVIFIIIAKYRFFFLSVCLLCLFVWMWVCALHIACLSVQVIIHEKIFTLITTII